MTFFYRRPRATILLLLLILVDGLAGLFTLPRMEDPVLSPRAALIITTYPGASAERVEALVTIPIEEELAEVDDLKFIRTESRPGQSTVIIEVKDELDEFVSVWSKVRAALRDAEPRLPEGASQPEFDEREARAYATLISLSWDSSAPFRPSILKRYGRELEDLLRAVSGTEEVDLFGAPKEEIQVLLEPENLARYRMTAAEVASQIAAFDVKSGAGRFRSEKVDLLLQLPELSSQEALSQVLVRAESTGRSIPLSEVAKFQRGERTPPLEKVLIEGERAVVVGAKVVPSQRVDLWSDRVQERLKIFQTNLPEGLKLNILFDQSEFTKRRLNELQRNGLLGAALVALTVFVAMGWRSAVAVSSALPLTTLVVLSAMKFMDIPIHQMSVTGLIIALGLLIDNAIVVTDELQQTLDRGAEMEEGIRETFSHLFSPLLSSTATTVLAFMPLVLMPGPAGEFVGSISLTVIAALIGSLLLSLFIIPVIYAYMRGHLPQFGSPRAFWNKGIGAGPLLAPFRESLRVCYKFPVLGISVGLVLPVLGFFAGGLLKEQFFPPSDRAQCELTVELASGTSLQETEAVVGQVREFLLKKPEIARMDWYLGRSSPAFYYNLIGTRRGVTNYAQAMVVLANEENIYGVQRELQNELDKKFPNARILLRQLEQGPPFDAPVELRLYGPDLEVLRALGGKMRLLLAEVPEITHTQASLDEDLVTLTFQPDYTQLRTAGLNSLALSEFLRSSTEGLVAGSILENTEEVEVRVRLDDAHRGELNALKTLEPAPLLPLEQLGQLNLKPDRAVITRRDRRRLNTIQGFLQSGVLPSVAVSQFLEKMEKSDIELPPGYELKLGGEAAERDKAVGNLLASAGALVVLMCSTLVLGFSSFRMAFIIGGVAVCSIGLSLGALYVFGYPFGFMAIVGAMGLVGIAINDSIVVLAALLADRDARTGATDRMVTIVLNASRHVLTTTATTIAGFLPLLISGGSFWPPLAVAIAGGVSGATILALYFCPACFRLVILIKRTKPLNEESTAK